MFLIFLSLKEISHRLIGEQKIQIPFKICELELDPKHRQALLSGKETELINGFRSKNGKSFSAYLHMDFNGKLQFRFPLNHEIYNEKKIPSSILGLILENNIQEILKSGNETPLLKGFTSKRGQKFDAYLKRKDNGEIEFRFPEKKKEEVPEQKSFRKEDKKEMNAESLEKTKNEDLLSKENGETKVISKIYGKELDYKTLESLKKGLESPLIKGFQTPGGKFFNAYLRMENQNKLFMRIPSKELDLKINAIPKIIFGITLSDQHKLQLKQGEETGLIEGFQFRGDKAFKARLKIGENGNLFLKSDPIQKIISLDINP